MDSDVRKLVAELREAGLSQAAINAAWPAWWTEAASASQSAQAELRFTLARRLGLSPKRLLGERVEFVWRDQARFKHLAAETADEQAALTSFGVAIAGLLLRAVNVEGGVALEDPNNLRQLLGLVDLQSLLAACWAMGIPVIHLRVFPLDAKMMHATVVQIDGRSAILLGRDANYPAPIAFTLAHELGHIGLGHIQGASALVDVQDPATAIDADPDEVAADKYALTLLTGYPDPLIHANTLKPGGRSLAEAAIGAGQEHNIEPGTLALCFGFQSGNWRAAMASLKHIYPRQQKTWQYVNGVAERQISWSELNGDEASYLKLIMGLPDD